MHVDRSVFIPMFENIWFNPEVIPGMAATLRRADDFFRYTETISFTRVGMLGELLILVPLFLCLFDFTSDSSEHRMNDKPWRFLLLGGGLQPRN